VTIPEALLGSETTFEAPLPETFRSLIRQKGWSWKL